MTRNLLGNPQLTVTDVNDVKEGLNHIVVDSVQFGNQEMIMEKDVAVEMKDGEKLYVNIFRPNKEGQFPLSCQPTLMVKIINLKLLIWGAMAYFRSYSNF